MVQIQGLVTPLLLNMAAHGNCLGGLKKLLVSGHHKFGKISQVL